MLALALVPVLVLVPLLENGAAITTTATVPSLLTLLPLLMLLLLLLLLLMLLPTPLLPLMLLLTRFSYRRKPLGIASVS